MLPISLVQYPDTPTYIEALSCSNITYMKSSKEQQEYSTAVHSLNCIKWNIDDVSS